MSHAEAFQYFSKIVYDHAGIALEPDKLYLVETRLASICRDEHCENITDLFKKWKAAPPVDYTRKVVEAMTTNETWWFRDGELFEALKTNVWPKLMARAPSNINKTISMWCAASSTGQEIYSLRMTWETFVAAHPGWKLRILATDIDNQALARAREGKYSQLEVGRGVPAMTLISSFEQVGADWKIHDRYKQDIEWRQVNLMNGIPEFRAFDIVLCRNVMIYFDLGGKKRVLGHIRNALRDDGALFLGGSESLYAVTDTWERVGIGKTFGYGTAATRALLETKTATPASALLTTNK